MARTEPAQYRAIRYTERLAEADAVASEGSKGDNYDNALAWAFNSLYKGELVRNRGPWTSTKPVATHAESRSRSRSLSGLDTVQL